MSWLLTALIVLGPTIGVQQGPTQFFLGDVLPTPPCADIGHQGVRASVNPPDVMTSAVVFRDRMGELTAQDIRHMNPAGNVASASHRIPDLLGYQIGNWQPHEPDVSLYSGCWNPDADFFRIDIAFSKLVNPPGCVLPGNPYDPYKYGPHPVFGFVEFDMDNKVNSGGETTTPQNRFLGNVARFGGRPRVARFANRVATSADDFDDNISTAPHVERSGEEFHIALLGKVIVGNGNCDSVVVVSGDGDCVFEKDETWLVSGRWLHRAHGYEQYSGAGGDGEYEPILDLRIQSFSAENKTVLSIVYPLNNAGSAAKSNDGAVENPNGNDEDQNSIEEALTDLEVSAMNLANAPPIIADWTDQSAGAFLDSEAWHVNVLVGMAYVNNGPPNALFAWTDTTDEPVQGDFNGDGFVTETDVGLFDAYIVDNDGEPPIDEDQDSGNNSIDIIDFGPNFSLYDLDYNGTVDHDDRCLIVVLGDLNGDFAVDMDDVPVFVQGLLGLGAAPVPASCPAEELSGLVRRGDFSRDGALNGDDISGFIEMLLVGSASP